MKKTALAIGLPVAFLLTGCAATTPEPAATPSAPAPVEVRYEVDFETTHPQWVKKGPTADITYETPTGTQQQNADLPVRSKGTGEEGLKMSFPAGAFVYISAQKDENYGEVTCRIYANEKLISENTASGKYSIATCKGTAR